VKPKTLREAFGRMRDGNRSTDAHFRDLADALEIMVIMGQDTDSRDLGRDITDYRGDCGEVDGCEDEGSDGACNPQT
jgi:hypothetical protein